MRRISPFGPLLLLLAAFALPACQPQAAEPTAGKIGDPLPPFSLEQLAGGKLSREALAGKPALFDFWATWCKPCHVQTEILHTVLHEGSPGAAFYAVNSGEDRPTVEGFVAKQPFSYPVLLDPDDIFGGKLEVAALPTVVIVDRAGKIAFVSEGITGADVIRAELKKAGAP